ncbi:MAG: NAD(P)/FAD-dependent oxidoreductase [Rubrobacteraceae bacterium]
MKGKLALAAAAGVAFGAYRRYSKPEPLGVGYPEAPTKVLIVGGGFGGLAALGDLVAEFGGGREVGVAVMDSSNYTTFWPMVPSAISGDIEVRHAAHSIRRITQPLGAEFYQAEMTGADFEAGEVHTSEGSFPYDYLVLAPGSRTTFFGTPGAEEHAMDLKGLKDALMVRNRIIDRFEEAERLKGEFEDGLLTFVVVGGGATGVEAMADAHDLVFEVLEKDYPNVDFGRVRMVLVNSPEHILKGLDPALANAASRRLGAQKVEVLTSVKVSEVRKDGVTLSDGTEIPAHTTIWAAGIEPPPLVGNLDLPKDRRGRILIDEFLRVKDRPGVYSVGDCTHLEYDGPPLPALAQTAEQQGAVAARNIAAEVLGKSPTEFQYKPLGQLVDLGPESALVDILGIKLNGWLGAAIWKGVYLLELGYNLNRAQVLADWTLDLFARPDTSKLFEEEKP